ncbi:lantibiotic dehydratase [Streptomyces sp. NPDC059467]|uniref:lantibiotic dehydratase n=1 Tax=Streptomyces sp. NPDC059467 TaxID=3346844 RepID=UPI0036950C54
MDVRDLPTPFAEAVDLASPSLGQALTKDLSVRRADRARESLTRYLLRMAGRATPFGLMAGVALGSFGAKPAVRLGDGHQRHVRIDRGWLAALVTELEKDLDLLEQCTVVADDLVYREGGLAVQPFGTGGSRAVRRTVRLTPLVVAVLTRTAEPVGVASLTEGLLAEFPGAPRERLIGLIGDLVGAGFLLTSLRRARSLEELPDHDLVRAARHAFEAYADVPSPATLAEVRRLAGGHEAVQVDLALDLDVTLPYEVAREAELAASVLQRVAAPHTSRSRAMASYHARFLDRYGLGRAVPLLRVIDPDSGLGFPEGYDARFAKPEADDADRRAELSRLLVESLLHDGRDVVLDDGVVDRLHRPAGVPPRSIDFFCTLVARDGSDFELIVSPLTGSQQAGSSLGRFAHLPGFGDALRALLPKDGVELVHAVTPARYGNLLQSERTLAMSLPLGLPPTSPDDVRLADVALVADAERLRLYSLRLGREIDLVIPHVLNTDGHAPSIVRLLRDVTLMGVHTFKGWSWGSLSEAPFLPAVRYGRTVLSPARWRARHEDVVDDDAIAAWRSRLRVPRHVRLTHADHHIGLDLDSPVHRGLLRSTVRSGAVDVYAELMPDLTEGWLRGPGGAFESELVLSLRARRPPRPGLSCTPQSAEVSSALPGGEWLYARIPCDIPRQRAVLRDHLLPWAAAVGTDRWFFVRYTDALGRPELRIRLHAPDQLPSLHDLNARLITAGLAGPMTLEPYDPEAGRYGGPSLMSLAERVFTADSLLVLQRLRGTDDAVSVARDLVALVRHFRTDGEQWLLSHVPDDYAARRLFAPYRAAALATIRPSEPSPADAVAQEWAGRLTEYGHRLAVEDRDTALAALLHMHCNRRLGTDPDAEHLARAIAAGALRAQRARAAAAR